MVVTVTMQGYIKRTTLDTFRAQRRGGKGRAGMATKDEDIVTELFVTSTHTPVLFFSTLGKVYRMKVWRLPEGGAATRGRPMINLLPLADGETISTVLALPEDEAEWGKLHVMFATAKGTVRRNSMDAFTNVPSNGKIAMKFEGEDEDDRLIGVALLDEADDVLMATRQGKAIRFAGDDVREFQSRNSTGVRGIRLARGRRGHVALDPAQAWVSATRTSVTIISAMRRGRALTWPIARHGSWTMPASRNSCPASSSSSRSAPTAMASCRAPLSIAAPAVAARASPISTISSATARWSRASRRRRAISSCW